MDSTHAHMMALRSPWYAGVRHGFDRFEPQALHPVLQKYDGPDFVDRVVADPQDSLRFDDDDVWSYPVPIPHARRGEGRLRFATHLLVRTGLRKLYQPSHERFYVVVVELFCDRAGLPRPGPGDAVDVTFVLRRRHVSYDVGMPRIRRAARDLTTHLLAVQKNGLTPGRLDRDVNQVLEAGLAADQVTLPSGITATVTEQAWMVGPGGHARWRAVDNAAPEGVDLHEAELPMWRLPPPAGGCDATRSLWFGLVPTASSEHADAIDDEPRTDQGTPKLDEHAIYQIRCIARRPPRPGHEHCPPLTSVSAPTEPFRLAAFFDADGTRNHAVSISLPDFRALAARAGQPAGPGGVKVTSPPRSQLSFPTDGIPDSGAVGGNVAKVCTFAIELFMIVAFFVFSLFLPIVVLIFQLWWLLALRFCLPPVSASLDLLATFLGPPGNKTIADLAPPGAGAPGDPDQSTLDLALGMPGAAAQLADPTSGFPQADSADFLDVIDPRTAADPEPPDPEPHVSDPLCDPHDHGS
jgi:hypothetical protein